MSPIWEIGHVAWFHERWELRHLRGEASVHPHADEFWDSAAVSHHSRWELPLPSREATLQYMRDTMDKALERLPDRDLTSHEAYFYWLGIMHEDMHGEAFTYTRQTLGYPAPVIWRAAVSALGRGGRGREMPRGQHTDRERSPARPSRIRQRKSETGTRKPLLHRALCGYERSVRRLR